MDSPYDPRIPGPLEGEQSPVGPSDPVDGPASDHLAKVLQELEASIEQPYEALDHLYADPVADALTLVETSTELQCPVISRRILNPFALARGRPEREDEQKRPIEPGHKPVAPMETSVTPQKGLLTLPQDNSIKPGRDFSPPRPKPARPWKLGGPSRQYPEPTYRMMGHSTGIRNIDNEPHLYCYLNDDWVTTEDCDSCADFEDIEYAAEGSKRCRHSYYCYSEDYKKSMDEYLNSRSESDEE